MAGVNLADARLDLIYPCLLTHRVFTGRIQFKEKADQYNPLMWREMHNLLGNGFQRR